MNASFYAGLEHILTKPRLSVYRQDGADDTTALARYLYNIALCRELYAPLHIFEVSLRNAIDEALCIFFRVCRLVRCAAFRQWHEKQNHRGKKQNHQERKKRDARQDDCGAYARFLDFAGYNAILTVKVSEPCHKALLQKLPGALKEYKKSARDAEQDASPPQPRLSL